MELLVFIMLGAIWLGVPPILAGAVAICIVALAIYGAKE